ncbi:hypothetical protein [Atlantibacter hermannii]|uniref:hypothetical protein n=1 Tax=Atlantibacter hermannii TaxID=565 RepID=UPI0028991C59|nr:hypothetical protein [Atlantibacter hermannii]MDW4576898.1 hypothetical protein [Atlantibacter hermannii]
MKVQLLLLLAFIHLPAIAQSIDIAMIGDKKAESHQVCGKNIDVQIRKMNDDSIIISLMNNKTHDRDFFRSTEATSHTMKYSKFLPVRFDNLSKTFIAEDKPDIEIVWGNYLDEKKAVKYNLALGPQVYECGLLQKWPNETANLLYGETQ